MGYPRGTKLNVLIFSVFLGVISFFLAIYIFFAEGPIMEGYTDLEKIFTSLLLPGLGISLTIISFLDKKDPLKNIEKSIAGIALVLSCFAIILLTTYLIGLDLHP